MRHLFNTKLKIIIILAVLLTAVLAVMAGLTNRSVPELLVQGVLAPFRAAASSGRSAHCVHQSLSILYSQQSLSRWSFPRYPPHKYPRLSITNPAASSLALPSKSERRYHTPNVSSSSSERENMDSIAIDTNNSCSFFIISIRFITF